MGDGPSDGGEPVRYADIFARLVAEGHGDHQGIAERLTYRQIHAFYEAAMRRDRHRKADLIEAVAAAMGSDELPDLIQRLRDS